MTAVQGTSASIEQPTYWWYRARSQLFAEVFGEWLPAHGRLLDVGSADGPSTAWAQGLHRRTAVDVDSRGLRAGDVCASALQLPFQDEAFAAVCAFDVLEHCEPEHAALAEIRRVLEPGGRVLMSVPAYSWAWSEFDVEAGHHRRYTRRRLLAAIRAAGFHVERASYAFMGTFPAFVAERTMRKWHARRGVESDLLPAVPKAVERTLMALCGVDRRLLRRMDLPYGSSVLVVATKASR